ncbi:MAG: ribbon-helix-helix domain-containing protein [Firmicutes bacterium]|nr:ribbon-helix-helix domain-containing protein [Bacillota bacterium]
MIRTQVQLTEDQVRALRFLAGERGVSMAELIRASVEHYLREVGDKTDDELVARAKEVAGKFRSGLPDLAENHDRYITGDERC